MKHIGFYGGTFNPIHLGHVGVCRTAVEQLRLDRLYLTPTFVPPHKAAPDLAPGEDRLEMCRLAVREIPEVVVDDYELRREGISYTILTLRRLREVFPEDEIYLIMGTDNFLTFELWRDWREIGKIATLAVASREEDDSEALCRKAQLLLDEDIHTVFLKNEVRVISSTEIRKKLKAGEESNLLPSAVMEYIKGNELYRGGSKK